MNIYGSRASDPEIINRKSKIENRKYKIENASYALAEQSVKLHPAGFRKMYPDKKYLGVELEINQKFVDKNGSFPQDICNKIVHSFRYTFNEFSWL